MSKRNIPIIVGVSLLILVPLCAGVGINFAISDPESEAEGVPKEAFNPNPEGMEGIKVAPVSPNEGKGSGVPLELPTEGIPTGTYSNPPTSIGSSGSGLPSSSQPLGDNSSSVESNQLGLESQSRNSYPRYDSPSYSTDFSGSQDNSLVNPLEDDSFLDAPEASDSDTTSPVAEPLFSSP